MKKRELYKFFDQIPEPIWVVDGKDTSFIDANKASIEHYGYSKEEFLKLKISDIDIILNDVAKVKKRAASIKKTGSLTFETKHRAKDGRILDVLVSVKSFPVEGQDLFSVVCQDVTETNRIKKELESSHKKFMTLFNQMPGPAWVVDVYTAGFLDINEAAVKQYGYTKEEFYKLRISDIDIYDDAEEVRKRSLQIEKEGYSKFETKHRTKDGKILDVVVSVQLFFIDEKPVFSATCHDITDVKQKEKQLQKLNRQLEKRVSEELEKHIKQQEIIIQQSKLAAIGELLSNIAHQWRQPLNMVSVGIQNIKFMLRNEQQDIEKMDNTMNNMLKRLTDLSDVINRFSSYFVSNDKKAIFSVNADINDTVSLMESRLKEHDISVELHGPQLQVEGFSNDFKQILMSLLSNAVDAISKKAENTTGDSYRGHIQIVTSKDNNIKKITVTDNGDGVSEAIKDKLFDPYCTTKFQSQGVGISLYMSKMIIERNFGGRLLLESGQNDGTSFVIELP